MSTNEHQHDDLQCPLQLISCDCAAELLEMLLSEENVMDVVGALEYDPELAVRQNHRAFLREHVIFKEVSLPLEMAFLYTCNTSPPDCTAMFADSLVWEICTR